MSNFFIGIPLIFLDGIAIPYVHFCLAYQPERRITFTVLPGQLKDFISGTQGSYVKYVSAGGEFAQPSLQTGRGIVEGREWDLRIVFPPAQGEPVGELHFEKAKLKVRQRELAEAWSMTAPTPLDIEVVNE